MGGIQILNYELENGFQLTVLKYSYLKFLFFYIINLLVLFYTT